MNDFDFLVGTWDSTQRRLRKRLVGSDDWEVFSGHSVGYRLFDGAANVDEITFPTLGQRGLSLRLYDPSTELWSIYWAVPGVLFPPVTGRFDEHGVGEFFGEEEQDGRPVLVRFRWSDITASTARWQQAFSVDGGENWETNWVMDFHRSE